VKLVFTLLVVGAIFYGVYSAALAAWSYFEISNLVEEVTPRELRNMGGGSNWERADRTRRLREAILKGAEQSGIVLDPKGVSVTESDGAIWVRITNKYPMVKFRGESMVTIPISTAHSFPVGH
jgi:hypothetical protein